MKRFFITLSYNGKKYVGWQIQPNGVSVQQVLQDALSTVLREPVEVVGAGRTDAGVHARKMVAHVDFSDERFDSMRLVKNLNSFLPHDISIREIREVSPDAHARFSAISRTYKYYLTTEKNPFLHDFTYRVFFQPDINVMNALCEVLKGYEDFTSFSRLHSDVKTNNCRISEAYWEQEDTTRFTFTITADRFLRNMVRAIVGTLLEAGRGKLDERGFRRIIEARNRQVAGDSAPGHALFLHEVTYPEEVWVVVR